MAKAGRKSKAEEMGLQKLLDKYVSNAARAKVVKRLMLLANDRKDPRIALEAIKLLMAYLYGTPKQSMELSGNPKKPIAVTAKLDDGTISSIFGILARTGALESGLTVAAPDGVHPAQPNDEAGSIPAAAAP